MNARNHFLRRTAVALCAASTLCLPTARAMDVFGVDQGTAQSPAANTALGPRNPGCVFDGAPASPLSLDEAIERALCSNPRTSEAWATVKLQAARLGISESAWLPTLSLTLERNGSDIDTTVPGDRRLDSGGLQRSNTQTLIFNWVIVDPSRGFDIRSSQSLLEASRANHADVLLSVFTDLSHDYFAAQAAATTLKAAIDLKATTQSSYLAAKGRADRGVAPISDALQAQTALAEAELAVARAQGDLRTATGSLAWRMGLRPDTALVLPPTDDDALAAPPSGDAIDTLITRVQEEHPHSVQAARQLDAARARVEQARAELLPKVTLNMRAGHDSTPVTPFIGSAPMDARSRVRTASLSISVPLFDGFGSNYRIDQAERTMEVSRAQLDEARQQVADDAWKAFQSVQTAYTTFEQTRQLLATARASFTAANERYRAGVGAIADLLSAQSALINANNRKVQALSDWRSANAALWARLGQIRGA